MLDDLALAQGQATGADARRRADDAGVVVSNRSAACSRASVLASWRWWLGLGMLVMWMAIRRPAAGPDPGAGGAVRGGFGAAAAGLVPAAAGGHAGGGQGVEGVRVGGRPVDRYRVPRFCWRWPPRGRCCGGWTGRCFSCRCPSCWRSGFFGYLGLVAYRGEIGLGTLAVMLPMLAATTPLGDISWDDVALSWMIQGLPRARDLETALAVNGPGGVAVGGWLAGVRGTVRAGAVPVPGSFA